MPPFSSSPSFIITQLRRRLEANTEAEELQKQIKVLQVRLEKERHRVGELETALKAVRESATSTPSPPSSSKGHSMVNNKVRVVFVYLLV